jgi:hypothetical protein
MIHFTQEHGIPMPFGTRKFGRYSKFREAFESLPVGDSIFVTLEEGKSPETMRNLLIGSVLKFYKGQHRSTTLPDGVRVWKIEKEIK